MNRLSLALANSCIAFRKQLGTSGNRCIHIILYYIIFYFIIQHYMYIIYQVSMNGSLGRKTCAFRAMAKGTHWNSLNIVLEDVMGLAQVSELTSWPQCRPNLYKMFAVCMYIILYYILYYIFYYIFIYTNLYNIEIIIKHNVSGGQNYLLNLMPCTN